jgi:hypothetical protein
MTKPLSTKVMSKKISPSGFADHVGMRDERFWARHKTDYTYAFVHINKCGGTSIQKYLGQPKVHYTAQEAIDKIGIDKWNEHFTFSVVRHPYSRVVSLYNYRVSQNTTKLKHNRVELNEWIVKCFQEKDRFLAWPRSMFMPAIDWLLVDGKIAVKKVVKLENINNEWKSICEGIGCHYQPLHKHNATKSSTYETALENLNETSVKIINERFKRDFEEFDYEIKKV